jgi:hypothetical protein
LIHYIVSRKERKEEEGRGEEEEVEGGRTTTKNSMEAEEEEGSRSLVTKMVVVCSTSEGDSAMSQVTEKHLLSRLLCRIRNRALRDPESFLVRFR